MKTCHLTDGASLVRMFTWLEGAMKAGDAVVGAQAIPAIN